MNTDFVQIAVVFSQFSNFQIYKSKSELWSIGPTDICDTILFLQVYAPQNLDIESKLKDLRLLVSEIDVLLWKWPPCFFNGFQNGGCNGMMYSVILSMKSIPHKT